MNADVNSSRSHRCSSLHLLGHVPLCKVIANVLLYESETYRMAQWSGVEFRSPPSWSMTAPLDM